MSRGNAVKRRFLFAFFGTENKKGDNKMAIVEFKNVSRIYTSGDNELKAIDLPLQASTK